MDMLSILENSYSERFHNFIVNIFDVALVHAPMPLPNNLPQIEPNIFLKVDTSVASQLHILEPSFASVFSQFHNYAMKKYFVGPSLHWSPNSHFADSLHSAKIILYLLRSDTLRMYCMYERLWSTPIGEVIYRCSNTPTVRSRITRTTAGPYNRMCR